MPDATAGHRHPGGRSEPALGRPAGLPPLWLEAPAYERWFAKAGVPRLPSWATLEVEAQALGEAVARGEPWDRVRGVVDAAAATPFPSPLRRCDVRNAVVFTLLPSVWAVVEPFQRFVLRALHDAPADAAKTVVRSTVESWYQVTMFRRSGSRVYVVDPHTFELLARTELPVIPSSHLNLPLASFYLLLPTGMFEVRQGETVYAVRGVTVSADGVGPAPNEHREVRLWIDAVEHVLPSASTAGTAPAGEPPLGATFLEMTIQLRPDATLPEVMTRGVESLTVVDAGDLALDSISKVVTGLCLYLMSEHPRLEPVPPAPRIEVGRIHNATKRRKAEQRNARSSRLGYIRVGAPAEPVAPDLAEAAAETSSATPAGRWRLDHQVWVRGHWRYQSCGTGHREHRLLWIKPHVKGPDYAASLAIRAARVQPARPVIPADRTPLLPIGEPLVPGGATSDQARL